MEIYLVGGAVRNQLLGLPVVERDWVVVGATPDQMLALGYQPVGKAFPVFLHPETHEEYALARTERKEGRGYTGFTFNTDKTVTLVQDLSRRDLTINAIAQDSDGQLIDPYGGIADLRARQLRHVSAAFVEDPVRLLRVARFAASFAAQGFTVVPETLSLLQTMVIHGEVNYLTPERVWQEFQKTLMTVAPSQFFNVLQACQALPIIFPEIQALPFLLAADQAGPPWVRFASLMASIMADDANVAANLVRITTLSERLRTPKHYRELALLTARYYQQILNMTNPNASMIVTLLSGCDAFRRPERFQELLQASRNIGLVQTVDITPICQRLSQAVSMTQQIDTQILQQQNLQGPAFAEALQKMREQIIHKIL